MKKLTLMFSTGLASLVMTQAAFAQAPHDELLADKEEQAKCELQTNVENLTATVSAIRQGEVIISWSRNMTDDYPFYRVYNFNNDDAIPAETWIAIDGNAMTNGRKIPESWFAALEMQGGPMWTKTGLAPGDHSATVAHKSDCGTWGMEGVSFTIPGDEEDEIEDDEFEEVSYPISDEEAEDLSFGSNLGRYGSCMVGGFTRVRGGWSIIRRNGRAFVTNWVKSPLRVVMHPVCLIRATGGLETPPDPDRGIMNCYPQMGILTECPSEWITFYQSPDGTEALDRMGPGPAPTAEGRDDQARLSCMAVILQKYNEYGRDLDAAFEDPWLIQQGCNKARPQ